MTNLFISRYLQKNSSFYKLLKDDDLTIISESLVEFRAIPFTNIPTTDWLFFYSKNGVKFFFQGLERLNIDVEKLGNRKWGVMGKGTAKALKKYIPAINFTGTGHPQKTAAAFLEVATQQKVLFVRAKQSKMSVQKLVKNQLVAQDLIVYSNTIKEHFDLPFCKYLVFTSPLNAQAYFQKYRFQKEQKVIAIGKTTAAALQQLGIAEVVIAEKPTEKAMAVAVGSRQ